jgi:hypothetical protein
MFVQVFNGVKNTPTNVRDNNEKAVLFVIKVFERKRRNCCTVGIPLILLTFEQMSPCRTASSFERICCFCLQVKSVYIQDK